MVCTANICRSPTAEYLLRNELLRLAPLLTFEVSSAGVRGWDGSEMDRMAAAELRRLGGDPANFRARSFTAAMGGAADLLLTATTEHRRYVLQEVPQALRRTFTLLEFAYLAAATEDVRDARGDAPEVVKRRLSQEYQDRVDQTVAIIREDLTRESAGVAERLASLGVALVNDNRFRLAAVAGLLSEREYLLDYAGTAMRLTGLTTLQIQDAQDQIISSGHFRNEHGRTEPGLASALNTVRRPALTMVRTADGQLLTLARSESFSIAGQTFTLVGGIAVDNAFLARLARDRAITVSITYPGGEIAMGPVATVSGEANTVGVVTVPFVRSGSGTSADTLEARVQVTQPLSALGVSEQR